jgi:hypothetical protein
MASNSSGAGFYGGAADLTRFQEAINGIMGTMQLTNDAAIYSRLAFVDNGSTTNGTPVGREIGGIANGSDGQAGDVVHYPLSPVTNAPKYMPLGVPRQTTDAVIVDVAVERQGDGVDTERLYIDKQDPYQILLGKQGAIASRMLRAPDFRLAYVINSNPIPVGYFDGLPYFHTAHPVKPGSSITFSNSVTCTDAEWESGDGMGILLNALASIPWFDGKLKDGSMAKPMIVTSNMLRAAKARQVLGMITTTLGSPLIGTAAGGSQQSPWSGMASSVENFQDLFDPTNFADSGKYVYAFATTGGATQPAFIVSPKRWPEFHVYGLDPNEEIRRVWRAIGWDWDAFYGVGPGLPQCGARIKIG